MPPTPHKPPDEAWTIFGRWRRRSPTSRRIGVALLLLALLLTLLWARTPRPPLDDRGAPPGLSLALATQAPTACAPDAPSGALPLTLPLPAADAAREQARHWQALTPEGRALWGWPAPGMPFDAAAPFPVALPEDAPQPPAFLLLRIALEQVELLELGAQPHRRRRWQAASDWGEERLNP